MYDLTHMKNCKSIMVSIRPTACWLSGVAKKINIVIFSDTINVINVKLCMMLLLIELYLFILFSVMLTVELISRTQQCLTLLIECLCSYPI